MTAGQTIYLCKRIIHSLRIETAPALKKRIFVAEIAMLRASASHNNGIGHQIVGAVNEVATDGRNAFQRASSGRNVGALRLAFTEVLQELRKCLFAGAKEDCVGMSRCLFGKGSDVPSSQADKRSTLAIVVGNPVCPICIGDVNLNYDEVRRIRQVLAVRHVHQQGWRDRRAKDTPQELPARAAGITSI